MCGTCGFAVPGQSSAFTASTRNTGTPGALPWEDMESLGVLKSLCRTIVTILFKPSKIFAGIAHSNDVIKAWLYGMIIGSAGVIFNFFWGNFIYSSILETFRNTGFDIINTEQTTAIALILTPVFITANIAITTLYCHCILFLFGRTKQTMSSTFRIVCYSKSPAMLNIIPAAGPVIAAFWTLYLVVAGEAYIYKQGKLRTFSLLLFPAFLAAMAVVFLLVVIAGAGLAAGSFFKDFLEILR
jgi:hypothetical protein